MEHYGYLSLLPVVVVTVLVLVTKRTTASLLAGTLVGAFILYGKGFAKPWIDVIYGVLGSDLWIWLLLVCGSFGSLVALFEASGGLYGFSTIVAKLCKGTKTTLLATWFFGMVIFIDDWLSILTVGSAMRNATDRFRIPREMLAFLCGITATAFCVIVPISTWGVFMTSQIVSTGVSTKEMGLITFIHTIPYMFYPLLALLCGALYAANILPKFGPMKKVWELSAQKETGDTMTPEKIEGELQGEGKTEQKGNVLNFLIPITLMTGITIVSGEILYGTLACLLFCAIFYLPQKLMTAGEYLDKTLAGFKDMMGVISIVTVAFMLRDINALLGLPDFVIGVAQKGVGPAFLPVITFLIVSALGFAAGNFWGICAISFPIIIPVARALDCDLLLVSGAIISATVASSCLCFFGSEVTLACYSAQIKNVDYARTALPLVAVPFLLAAVFYLVAGIVVVAS
ncbi:MAG: Na+/H+ antiporter NhaC family protein [Eubacteriales bacterium]|nr:Na+/H+ antiporter NhaC family protein [Eubacteriales bacterium]MDD3349374.1 Na+/H+ antiporter NhaC family protein [Eubacteriales bacterium]